MKLNIRTKLLGSFIIVVLLLVAISWLSINKMGLMNNDSQMLKNKNVPGLALVGEISTNLYKLRGDLFKVILETDDTELGKVEGMIAEDQTKLADNIKSYAMLELTEEQRSQVLVIEQSLKNYNSIVPEVISYGIANDFTNGYKVLVRGMVDLQLAIDTTEQAVASVTDGANVRVESIVSNYTSGSETIIIFAVIAVILAIVLALIISQGIVGSVSKLLALMVKMASGDLRENMNVKSRDEFGKLADAVNAMIVSLRKLIGNTVESAQNVAASSQEISATIEQISDGSQSQAQSAQNISELTQELSKAINEVAKNAEQVSELSAETKLGAEEGSRSVRESSLGMNKLSEKMGILEQDSHKIGEIIEVINEIAEQTNLLALNAAIEAARAGEQGRGFAVVADEVRKLAERSSEATKQIAHIIRGMQQNTVLSVQAVSEASVLSDKTEVLIEGILSRVNETSQQITSIAAACEEQAAQTNEVLLSVESIAAGSQEAAAAAEETAASSQMLAKLADELNDSAATFKL
ncbi:methyl-accepting chemotaxis protein [Paenibacillus monticola]|uniref:HAMP domain-containing protein n=1 Tax=Paenibacillus monticola TaxID=2666075 RepID=A0A7X2H2F3_9BACL|nr:methyl-accepting chemotaxis protein [Paenibacillus monticola]MRN51423.1 HAMP domain-containing protein [Paenibacillus monticola]